MSPEIRMLGGEAWSLFKIVHMILICGWIETLQARAMLILGPEGSGGIAE